MCVAEHANFDIVLTAAISAAIVAAFALFGIRLSAAQIAGVAITVKVILVVAAVLVGLKVKRKRDAAAAKVAAETPPVPPAERTSPSDTR